MSDARGRGNARLARLLLAATVVVGGLALWTVLPVAWLQLTSDLAPGGRFVLVIVGLPLTMAIWFGLLSQIDAHRTRLAGGESSSLLEVTLVASAVTAVVALIVWWAFFAESADPSGPLQPI
jgi:hypothetical protein